MTSVDEKTPIDIDTVDNSFVELIKKTGGSNIQNCYQCGTCSGSCPAGARTNFLVRNIIRKALLGLKEQCVSDPALWFCTTCYTCVDRCPQDVNPTDVIKAIRNIAVQSGYMLVPHQKVAQNVLKTGHAVPLAKEMWEKLRQKVGLEPVPPNASLYPEAIIEIQKMMKKCGFDELVADKEKAEE